MSTRKILAEKNKILRFGVIGIGGMGRKYCQILGKIPRVRLAAVCDVNAGAAEEAAKKYGAASFSSHLDLIKARCCDVVVIVTPHPFHCRAAVDCMRAGLHVVTEKPLSERVSTADKMIKTARACRVAFVVMFQIRLEPIFQQALKIVKSGQIGKIHRTAMFEYSYRSQRYYDSGVWRATWKGEGGGVLINQAPHMLDIFIQLGGLPSAVFGRTETRMHRIEVEDHAEALLKYKGGASGYIYVSTNETGPGQMIELWGDKGKLIIRDKKLALYRFAAPLSRLIREDDQIWSAPKTKAVPLAPVAGVNKKSKSGHQLVLENVVNHLLQGAPLLTPGASGLGSLELANAITLSSHEGRWIKLPLDRKRYDRLLAKLQRGSNFVKKNVRVEHKTDPRLG